MLYTWKRKMIITTSKFRKIYIYSVYYIFNTPKKSWHSLSITRRQLSIIRDTEPNNSISSRLVICSREERREMTYHALKFIVLLISFIVIWFLFSSTANGFKAASRIIWVYHKSTSYHFHFDWHLKWKSVRTFSCDSEKIQ